MEDCARAKSANSLCNHIVDYYEITVGNPILYCKIDENQLFNFNGLTNIIQELVPSLSGDECHVDLCNVERGPVDRFFRQHFVPPNIYMCCNGEERQLTKEQYEDLMNNLC